jgi:hypothetical protein
MEVAGGNLRIHTIPAPMFFQFSGGVFIAFGGSQGHRPA